MSADRARLRRSRRRDRRSRRDRGAVMVELAVALPLLALLAMGTIEFGLAWRETNTVERAVLNAGRTGATLGDARPADLEVLRTLVANLASLDRTTATKVVIYRSASADGAVPAACTAIDPSGPGAHGVAGLCNVYSATQLATLDVSSFGGTASCAGGSWDARWCPTDRQRDLPDPDYLGVWIELEYSGATGLVSSVLGIERSAVYSLEPEIDLGA